jgi:membrane protease YdiL (CAAX protease family)
MFLASLTVVGNVALALLGENAKLGYWSVVEEAMAYGIMLFTMKVIFFWQQQPLFRSLAWKKTVFSVSSLAAIGLSLFAVSVLLQVVLRTPDVSTPFEKMLRSDTASRLAITVFGITMGPLIEELLFRGFLQPVLVSAAGVLPGILITAAIFGGMHLAQNAGMWQSGVIITVAGFGFGMIRHITGSTQASTIAHIAYNTLPFLATTLDGANSTPR